MAGPLGRTARPGPEDLPTPPVVRRRRRARLRAARRTLPLTLTAGDAYRALAPAVLAYLRAQRVGDPEDLLGEVFLQVARDIGRFSGDAAALRRWVFAIAHNRVLDARRREARRPRIADGDVPEVPARPPSEPVDPALLAALDSLTTEQREVILLRFVADLSLEDVAKLTRRKVGAVKALQHRGLENLGRILPPAGDAL